MFRILVTGSRSWEDWDTLYAALTEAQSFYGEITIVHGGARGADEIAGSWAQRHGVPVEVFKADWKTYGGAAGAIRNKEMIDTHPELVIAFMNGSTPGTQNCIKAAKRAGIPVIVKQA